MYVFLYRVLIRFKYHLLFQIVVYFVCAKLQMK